ncbi:hypothetical protein AMTR_s00031p00223630 [Amborella trichopoda]|uniref:Uncharacterized protein n=1 Tax=Amborella trichopoda TaxID=13333 RepID=U5D2Z4_AMBTC|nr:hypothetical protein AMTR_s00031p00223630 [Amborella trichopoda]
MPASTPSPCASLHPSSCANLYLSPSCSRRPKALPCASILPIPTANPLPCASILPIPTRRRCYWHPNILFSPSPPSSTTKLPFFPPFLSISLLLPTILVHLSSLLPDPTNCCCLPPLSQPLALLSVIPTITILHLLLLPFLFNAPQPSSSLCYPPLSPPSPWPATTLELPVTPTPDCSVPPLQPHLSSLHQAFASTAKPSPISALSFATTCFFPHPATISIYLRHSLSSPLPPYFLVLLSPPSSCALSRHSVSSPLTPYFLVLLSPPSSCALSSLPFDAFSL